MNSEEDNLWKIPRSETSNGDSALYALNTDVAFEILRYLDFDYIPAITSCRLFADASRTHRGLFRVYGKFLLTHAQSCAFEWVEETWKTDHVAALKAPPSWGKTVLMLSVAIEQARNGKKVVVRTIPAMMDAFVKHLKDLAPDEFDFGKNYKETRTDGKLRLLVALSRYSKAHNDSYRQGKTFDLLLIPSSRTDKVWYISSSKHNLKASAVAQVPCKFDPVGVDVLIMDEAHKSEACMHMFSYLFRKNEHARALVVSASDIHLDFLEKPLVHYDMALGVVTDKDQISSSHILYSTLRLSRKSIEAFIPEQNLRFISMADPGPEKKLSRGLMFFRGANVRIQDYQPHGHLGPISNRIPPLYVKEVQKGLLNLSLIHI